MPEMTDAEIEAAVAHDMKVWEESLKERGIDPDAQDDQPTALDRRLELIEARTDAKVQALRADLTRWMLLLFCAATLLMALFAKL
jgi:hypothetical protein